MHVNLTWLWLILAYSYPWPKAFLNSGSCLTAGSDVSVNWFNPCLNLFMPETCWGRGR